MIDVEQQLRDLGEQLDHPPGDQIVAELRARLASPTAIAIARPSRSRRRMVMAGLVAAAAVVLLAVSLPPSRDAIADILGLGSSEVVQPVPSTVLHHPPSTSTTPTTAPPAVMSVDLATARTVVDFPIRVPAGVDAVPSVTVDRRVPGGLVALEYPTFTVVEVASPPDVASELLDLVGPESQVQLMSVRGRPGMWITGTHDDITYLDRDGNLRHGATRANGHVLLWEEGGVTYRIEGFPDEASAAGMATSMS